MLSNAAGNHSREGRKPRERDEMDVSPRPPPKGRSEEGTGPLLKPHSEG